MRGGPVRVLRVIARLNAGGPAHHVGILSSRLADRGYETLLVHGRVAKGEEMLGRFDERSPTQRRELDVLGREPRPIDDVLSLWQLIRSVRSFRPAIVHTHTAKAGVLGRIAALAIRPRPVVVHTYHGHVFHGYFGRLTSAAYRRVEQALSLVTDCLVAVSDATARDLRRLGVGTPDKIRVVRLGLDLEPFAGSPPEGGRSLRRLVGAQERDLLAVTIGRLVHIKRIDLALSAVAEAVALGVPVRLAV